MTHAIGLPIQRASAMTPSDWTQTPATLNAFRTSWTR